jgi:hypothetical protein
LNAFFIDSQRRLSGQRSWPVHSISFHA